MIGIAAVSNTATVFGLIRATSPYSTGQRTAKIFAFIFDESPGVIELPQVGVAC